MPWLTREITPLGEYTLRIYWDELPHDKTIEGRQRKFAYPPRFFTMQDWQKANQSMEALEILTRGPFPILCLDFDGVLHSYTSPWQDAATVLDPPVPGAIEFILSASEHFNVNIFSSRSHQPRGIEAMKEWLLKWGLKKHELGLIEFPLEKPPAKVTIDDRAITFNGMFPDPIDLLAFKPWNKT